METKTTLLTARIKDTAGKIINIARSEKLKPLINAKCETIVIWVIVFVINEVIISGGRHSQNYYLFSFNIFALLMLFGYANIRRASGQINEALKRAGVAVLVFAVLDFLIINLLLEKNNLSIYKAWQTYVAYAAIILTTLAISRFKKPRPTAPPQEIPLDKPWTLLIIRRA